MKPPIPTAAVALLVAASAHANLIPLSGSAGVAVSGLARSGEVNGGGGDSYAHSQATPAPFAGFNGNASGAATWTIPPAPPGQQFFLPTTFSASSQATQNTTINAHGISIAGTLNAEHGANVGNPYAFASASADSLFDVVFTLDQPMAYALTLSVTSSHGHGSSAFIVPPTFSFASLGGGFSLDTLNLIGGPTAQSYAGSGVLGPGDYRLVYNLVTSSAGDPLGDFDRKAFSLGLQVASVPDAGATALLLGCALAALAALRRFRPTA